MSLSMLLLFSVSASFAQATTETVSTDAAKTVNCTPSPECAAKMGMTLEECKKLCSTNASAECKAKCIGKASADSVNDNDVKVASASFVSEIETTDSNLVKTETAVKEKVCKKGSKACCKKKS